MGLLDTTDECRVAVEQWNGEYGAPAHAHRKTERLQVFRNVFIERVLATSHPVLPGVWFGPVIVYGLATGVVASPLRASAVFALGALIWTLLEYTLHRWVFHLPPNATFASKSRQFMMHGYHHQFPNDRLRLVAPPIMSWPLAAVVAGLYWLVAGESWLPLFAGTCAGYLAYDWIHYYTHHFTPTTRFGKYVRRIHMLHHFANPERNHGISSPLWDFVFRTYQDRGQTSAD